MTFPLGNKTIKPKEPPKPQEPNRSQDILAKMNLLTSKLKKEQKSTDTVQPTVTETPNKE